MVQNWCGLSDIKPPLQPTLVNLSHIGILVAVATQVMLKHWNMLYSHLEYLPRVGTKMYTCALPCGSGTQVSKSADLRGKPTHQPSAQLTGLEQYWCGFGNIKSILQPTLFPLAYVRLLVVVAGQVL